VLQQSEQPVGSFARAARRVGACFDLVLTVARSPRGGDGSECRGPSAGRRDGGHL